MLRNRLRDVLFLLALIALFFTTSQWIGAREIIATLEMAQDSLIQLNEDTRALLARERIVNRDSIAVLNDAVKDANGKLVAALRIRTKPDTVYLPMEEIPTEEDSTGVLYATLTDTLKQGHELTITARADSTISLGYRFIQAPFEPQIGFMERNGAYYAVVHWAGMQYEVRDAFYKRPSEPRFRLFARAGAFGNATSLESDIAAGISLRVDKRGSAVFTAGLHDFEKKAYIGYQLDLLRF